ncbi:bifunctional ADP-dependent NAD(P)H-hydrate dehydratase/NAD(P)H-hydrate epimerase [Luteimonas abyssi]|uniref:bifunctional ADP-dependent NAD(P)H-hydrate dehydratase/NAD(P)H-hydrate epimerase n=1 Tax=Luteimonas abyssi TaxID=1247514 RepID=UPI000737AE29|nr:bifunctional ADP-dependent NAD(P)H-hydrate dehydratase/NAD(P)H-hydrate epimerase [Luteimonas abyssi]
MTDRLPDTHVDRLYDNTALRTLEAAAIDAAGDDDVLMARAGASAWAALRAHWPDAQRVLVLCGPGNNGGDGYVLASHARDAGCVVTVAHLIEHMPRSAPARRAAEAYHAAGGETRVVGDDALPVADVIVDALLGIGLDRPPDAALAALMRRVNAAGTPVLALDTPSGVDAGTGYVSDEAIRATVTVQFLAAHLGLATGAGLEHAGECELDALEVADAVLDGVSPTAIRLRAAALRARLSPRARNSHKGDAGYVLCVGGDHGHGGAIMLAAEAALRSGAGLVGVATRQAHVGPLLSRRPEAMPVAVGDSEADKEAFAGLLERADVVALGPGLGTAPWGSALYRQALACARPLVLDADALNLLAVGGDILPPDAVLTPHPGEAGRLLGCSAARVQADRPAALAALVQRYGCVVVLKGAGTLVAAPGVSMRVIAAGNPGMAVGGMGDVLTGCIAALRAQGHAALEAATTGALLHACAGDLAAVADGARGLLPSDLLFYLRREANP